ncbi:unnamed protein product [Cladocopium goreaui]|uniref:Pentacotripeptide-repeat region of PRORP domain-containing protein n=1 Tax=Cladocopium goreaui TaxID=2562237 RepID=A0A9P1CFW9_9DINO|nr:unnamed protein product [Cladocopium goreaui]
MLSHAVDGLALDPKQGTKVLKRLACDVSAVSLLRQLRDGQMELDLIHFSALSARLPSHQWPQALWLRYWAAANVEGEPMQHLIFDTAVMRVSRWPVALELLRRRGVRGADVVALNSVLAGAAWATALSLLSYGARRRLGDAVSKNSAAQRMSDHGAWRRVLRLVGGQMDLVSFTCCLGAVATVKRWAKAVRLLGHMETDGPRPNDISFNAAVAAMEGWQRANQLLCAAWRRGFQRNIVGYTSILSASAKRWREALQRWYSMAEVGLRPNEMSFTGLLSAIDFAQQWPLALRLWGRHLWLRSPVALNAALSAVARGERRIWPRALQMLNDSGDWQIRVDALGHQNLLLGLGSSLSWRLALQLLAKTPERGLPGAMKALCSAWLWEKALHLLCRMDELRERPEATSFASVLHAALETCAGPAVLALVQRLERESCERCEASEKVGTGGGMEADVDVSRKIVKLLSSLGKAKRADVALQLWEERIQLDQLGPWSDSGTVGFRPDYLTTWPLAIENLQLFPWVLGFHGEK